MNFNADGDKILTGSFDGTAIVIMPLQRFGTLNQASLFNFYKAILVKFLMLSFNLVVICVELHLLTRHAEFGMLEVGNVCQFSEAIQIKF